MWFFNSPQIVFGEGALDYLSEIQGQRAFIVTDANIQKLGFVDLVQERLKEADIECVVFAEVEPDPSLETVRRGAARMIDYQPDWIIGLGGGSCMDAAKAMWVLYEHPDMQPDEISPLVSLDLRQKARLITIPTTSGTGAEVTWMIVLTDRAEQRKLGLGSRESMADIAIVDPVFTQKLPPRITADTGMDALTHAVEGYACTWSNDFTDGLCLQAAKMVFTYLPRAYRDGDDMEAREHMHNAACIAGLGFGNAMAALAHAMGHSLGAVLHVPHGRAVGLFLPYTIEYVARESAERYAEMARFLGLTAASSLEAAQRLAAAIRDLARQVEQPTSLREMGIGEDDFQAHLEQLASNAEEDTSLVTSLRIPDTEELTRLFRYAYEGREVDF